MHQNKYFKTLRPLVTPDPAPVVTVLSIKGLLDIAQKMRAFTDSIKVNRTEEQNRRSTYSILCISDDCDFQTQCGSKGR